LLVAFLPPPLPILFLCTRSFARLFSSASCGKMSSTDCGGGGSKEAGDGHTDSLERALAATCLGPEASKALILAVTGRAERPSGPCGPGMRVATLAGITLISHLPVPDDCTLRDVKKAIAMQCPDWREEEQVVHAGTTYTHDSKALKPVKEDSTTGAALRALGDTLFVVRMKLHDLVVTTQKTEYEKGDINCTRCRQKGPHRKVGHMKCKACDFCGNCAILAPCCGADRVDPGDVHMTPIIQEGLDAYLQEFYKWQRGVMKPY
jgi:hypothetical protein